MSMPPKGSWINFRELQAAAEEAMLEETYAIETHGKMREDVCMKFVRTFDPETVYNVIQLLASFANLLCDYRGSHIGCDVVNGEDNRCVLCRRLENGNMVEGALFVITREDKPDGDRA
jgi:hypothetical protein